jgi:hypothetical protein
VVLQGWVARRLVRRQLATRLAPLIGCGPGERPLEATALSVQLLNAGAQGGYARDVAAQVAAPASGFSERHIQAAVDCCTALLPAAARGCC